MALHSSSLSNKQISTTKRVDSELEAQDRLRGQGKGWQELREHAEILNR